MEFALIFLERSWSGQSAECSNSKIMERERFFLSAPVLFQNNFESLLKILLGNLCCGVKNTPENIYVLERGVDRTPENFYAPERGAEQTLFFSI